MIFIPKYYNIFSKKTQSFHGKKFALFDFSKKIFYNSLSIPVEASCFKAIFTVFFPRAVIGKRLLSAARSLQNEAARSLLSPPVGLNLFR
jgi:hypothetical protein